MSGWQPPGHPVSNWQPSSPVRGVASTNGHGLRHGREISEDVVRASSTHSASMYYPTIMPSTIQPTQHSYSGDAYVSVDQVQASMGPVVSRQQVLSELAAAKGPASISGLSLATGAEALNGGRGGGGPSAAELAHAQQHGTLLEQWLVPDRHIRHWALWTSVFSLVAAFLFAFMAGAWPTYQLSAQFKAFNPGASVPLDLQWGPAGLLPWLRFWQTSPATSFDLGFLMGWGARYTPSIAAGEWWRLFSSIAIHGSFAHLFSNLLIFVVLAAPLEHTYGPFRIFLIFVASGLGGTFASMALEDACHVYVGASGAVFGFIGLYLADIVLNFESMFKPLLRLALMLASLGLTLGIEFAAAAHSPLQRVSHMSHIGGLVAGLCVSFMFIPNLRDRRWRAARKLAGRISARLTSRFSHGGAASGAGSSLYGDAHGPGGGGGGASPRVSAAVERLQSCWRRNAWLYYCLWVLCAGVLLLLFVGAPVYLWIVQMPALACPPLAPAAGR